MTRWRPYPEHKDSGVPWLGEIPAHWEVANLKYLLHLEYGDSLPADSRQEGCVPVFGSNGPVGTHSKPNTLAPVLIVGRKGSYGKVNFSDQPVFAIDTTYYVDSRSTRADLRWLFYALQLLQLDAFSQDSAIPGLSREFAYQQRVPNISLPEQRTIATFLDHQTAKIDALIAEQRHLIELLQERRAALISHAVTKGLDPEAPMKDSGIAWLSKIPAHWKVVRLAMSAQKITNGYVGPTRDIYVDDGIAYLQSLHVKNGKIDFHKPYYVTKEWSEAHAKSILSEGDLLIVQTGSIGECAVVPKEFDGANCHALIIVRLKQNSGSGFYLSAFLRSHYGRNMLLWSQTGALHPHLECGHVREIRILLPPLGEQEQIMVYLDRETAKIDALIAEIETGIAHLEEYRTALISAAVTGKIDVRDSLPSDAPTQPCLTSP